MARSGQARGYPWPERCHHAVRAVRHPTRHVFHEPTRGLGFHHASREKGLIEFVNPQEPLQIRTKDNNTVVLDVSVPVRIQPGRAHDVVATGNHLKDADGRYRYQRLAEQATVSVLREEMANLDSVGFYSTDRRAVEIRARRRLRTGMMCAWW